MNFDISLSREGRFDKLKREYELTKFPWTNDQLIALEKLIDFTYNDETAITIEGRAGTGKTSLIPELLKHRKRIGSVAVTATTHQAVGVIENMTKVKGYTIQSLLGLRPDFNIANFDINSPTFRPIGKPKLEQFILLCCDESSMLNTDASDTIINLCKSYGTKVIFIGDPYQAPPIEKSYSRNKVQLSPVFSLKNKIVLKEMVRTTEDNPLRELLDICVSDIDNNTNNLITHLGTNYNRQSADRKLGYYRVFHNKDGNKFSRGIIDFNKRPEAKEDMYFVKLTAYTNDAIFTWNKRIRSAIVKDPDSLISEDDILLAYDTLVDPVFYEPYLTNSVIYTPIEQLPFTKHECKLKGITIKLRSSSDGTSTPYLFIVDTRMKENITKYLSLYVPLLLKAKKTRRWREFYDFKNNNLLLANILKSGNDVRGANKILSSKHLDYGYAITSHKAQGSTYKNIFVDLRDMLFDYRGTPYKNLDSVRRLIYVAISRAKHKAIIYL